MGWSAGEILTLSLVAGLSQKTVYQCIQQYASFAELTEAVATGALQQLHLFGTSALDIAQQRSTQILQHCERLRIRLLSLPDPEYPPLLRHIPYPPLILYLWGNLQPDSVPVLSIVGTRQCTLYGKLCAERFSEACVRAGAVVCSGLARGIDTIVHETALRAGGTTYAIVASGLDRIQPSIAARLARRIVEQGGAILSEYPPGTKALPAYFPQRNRIISGIARAVLVVESGIPGGALITAQFAFDQGRDVYAVPGNITSEKSMGTNMLIRRNIATPALSPEEFLADTGLATLAPTPSTPGFSSAAEERLYHLLGGEPIHVDALAEQARLPVHEALAHLLELEFRGLVRQLPGKYFVRSL
ncbi:MAG: DNA-processing protein DprA [Candidatus Kapabacteria bacterium]|nr:DNA-processing protein DprA [Candidatus Kapabacteria bacterium]MCS7169193.1 DNA-processing protein DprA [Candidatus Kapabacteria bacterium]MDW7997682.1 DNA-processing protein DprA [Bacteroidota bacterium]MDW8224527.1 DNA-processing protein DprA [Bacteroidota bacterium]